MAALAAQQDELTGLVAPSTTRVGATVPVRGLDRVRRGAAPGADQRDGDRQHPGPLRRGGRGTGRGPAARHLGRRARPDGGPRAGPAARRGAAAGRRVPHAAPRAQPDRARPGGAVGGGRAGRPHAGHHPAGRDVDPHGRRRRGARPRRGGRRPAVAHRPPRPGARCPTFCPGGTRAGGTGRRAEAPTETLLALHPRRSADHHHRGQGARPVQRGRAAGRRRRHRAAGEGPDCRGAGPRPQSLSTAGSDLPRLGGRAWTSRQEQVTTRAPCRVR